MINDRSEYSTDTARARNAATREFLFPNQPPNRDVPNEAVGRRLKKHVGEPVPLGKQTLMLRCWRNEAKYGPNGPLSRASLSALLRSPWKDS
jgi:hypothetical protein